MILLDVKCYQQIVVLDIKDGKIIENKIIHGRHNNSESDLPFKHIKEKLSKWQANLISLVAKNKGL